MAGVVALFFLVFTAWAPGQDDAAPEDAPAEVAEPFFLAASDGEHLWYLRAPEAIDENRRQMAHHGSGMARAQSVNAFVVEESPQAIVAANQQVWAIFAPSGESAQGPLRSVSTMRAVFFDEGVKRWRFDRAQRSRTMASLPGTGHLAAVISDEKRPLVLLEQVAPESADQLWRLEQEKWVPITLPADLPADREWTLISGRLPMLIVTDTASGGTKIYELGADDIWTDYAVDFAAGDIRGGVVIDKQTVLALAGDDDETWDICYLRRGKRYLIGTWSDISPGAHLISYEGRLALIKRDSEDSSVGITIYEFATGQILEQVSFATGLVPTPEDWRPLILAGALLLSSIILILFRPDPTAMRITLPKNTKVAEAKQRLGAIFIDAIPAAVIAHLITQQPLGSVISIANWPLVASNPADWYPVLVMIVALVGHSMISEMIWGCTLGKAIFELRVVSMAGDTPRRTQILVRNVMKLIALIVPPLALFVFLNPFRQRLGDLLARTVVVHELETDDDEAKPSDESDSP